MSGTEKPAELIQAVHDHKSERVKNVPATPWCRIRDGKLPDAGLGHSSGCVYATIKSMRLEVDRARRSEQWARQRADYWLKAVRGMHGKMALLKWELKKLRDRDRGRGA